MIYNLERNYTELRWSLWEKQALGVECLNSNKSCVLTIDFELMISSGFVNGFPVFVTYISVG